MNFITETDRYIFGQGNHYEIYDKLGAHIKEVDGNMGVYFAVWERCGVFRTEFISLF